MVIALNVLICTGLAKVPISAPKALSIAGPEEVRATEPAIFFMLPLAIKESLEVLIVLPRRMGPVFKLTPKGPDTLIGPLHVVVPLPVTWRAPALIAGRSKAPPLLMVRVFNAALGPMFPKREMLLVPASKVKFEVPLTVEVRVIGPPAVETITSVPRTVPVVPVILTAP